MCNTYETLSSRLKLEREPPLKGNLELVSLSYSFFVACGTKNVAQEAELSKQCVAKVPAPFSPRFSSNTESKIGYALLNNKKITPNFFVQRMYCILLPRAII